MNFLNEQGLGGACELARAKANLVFAPPVYLKTNEFIF